MRLAETSENHSHCILFVQERPGTRWRLTRPGCNSSGVEISGMLGFGMFYQMEVRIDYRDALIDFGYDPKRWH
jgi:hypothetical protein